MSHSKCAQHARSPIQVPFCRFESLESRRLFAVSDFAFFGPTPSPLDERIDVSRDNQPGWSEPLFDVVPLDDHFEPLVDCPGIDSRFCLPKELPRQSERIQRDRPEIHDAALHSLIWGRFGKAREMFGRK